MRMKFPMALSWVLILSCTHQDKCHLRNLVTTEINFQGKEVVYSLPNKFIELGDDTVFYDYPYLGKNYSLPSNRIINNNFLAFQDEKKYRERIHVVIRKMDENRIRINEDEHLEAIIERHRILGFDSIISSSVELFNGSYQFDVESLNEDHNSFIRERKYLNLNSRYELIASHQIWGADSINVFDIMNNTCWINSAKFKVY